MARIFYVPTFRFNEAVKRNRKRFPGDFLFQLTAEEFRSLTSQIAILKERPWSAPVVLRSAQPEAGLCSNPNPAAAD
jgi:hypothetical protein